jgi:hypothetical protein
MSILMLWQASLGVRLPRVIDTGIDVITQENVDRYLDVSNRMATGPRRCADDK